MSAPDFATVTELGGAPVTVEQVERMSRRYYWAGEYCRGRDVLEVACGAAAGLGYLGSLARFVTAGDISESLLARARSHYGDRFTVSRFDAQALPFDDRSFDVVILFEALYYVPDPGRFFAECSRVLRPGGVLLVSTANKDLFDFNPSPYSHRYLGVVELAAELGERGFSVTCFGDTPLSEVGLRQRLLRPLKAAAARFGLIPGSMRAKELLKRLVFGRLVPMPAEITPETAARIAPTPLVAGLPDRVHKVVFCAAVLSG